MIDILPESIDEAVKQLVSQAAAAGARPNHLAQSRIAECRTANDVEGMRFWRNVWIRIMSASHPPS